MKLNIDEIELELTMTAKLIPNMEQELFGLIPFSVKIKQYYYNEAPQDEGYKEIGFINLMKVEENFDIHDALDSSDKTEHFLHLLNNDGTLKSKYANIIQKKYQYFYDTESYYVLTKAFIEEKYRGNRLLKSIYKRILNLLNINSCELMMLKAYAEDIKDTEKLKDYYQSIGFINLGKHSDGYIMCHPTEFNLKSQSS